jgi:hypothetical protein
MVTNGAEELRLKGSALLSAEEPADESTDPPKDDVDDEVTWLREENARTFWAVNRGHRTPAQTCAQKLRMKLRRQTVDATRNGLEALITASLVHIRRYRRTCRA